MAMHFFDGHPANDLLRDREINEAYCRAVPDKEYAVYFTNGGDVILNLNDYAGVASVQWLDILQAQWQPESGRETSGNLRLEAPGKGHWAALVTVQ